MDVRLRGMDVSVLVTGGAGYIGSHMAWELLDAGREVVVLDDLSTGFEESVPEAAVFVEGDVADSALVGGVLEEHEVESVIHFAASSVVPESVEQPLKYYRNNTCGSRKLIETCCEHGLETFIFSSTAAVYGIADESPVREDGPTEPINPYGSSKLMIERILADVAEVADLRYVALRYFNVAGADPKLRTGQSTENATHLIKVASQTAIGERDEMEIYGTDYPTPDGTCIRDYIHVTDLARAHSAALDYLAAGGESRVMNCGYGRGFSVREVVDTVREVSGVDFPAHEADRRAGDPPELVADTSRIERVLDWEPEHDDLAFIVETALEWERRLSAEGRSD